jgi:hypothetical protein
MGFFGAIGMFFKNIFSKVGAFVSRMWTLAKPFLQEALSQTAQNVWASTQDLFVEAAKYVGEQGLPTDEAKRKAFKEYMEVKAKAEVGQLKDLEFNLLREMAVAIWKKAAGQE